MTLIIDLCSTTTLTGAKLGDVERETRPISERQNLLTITIPI